MMYEIPIMGANGTALPRFLEDLIVLEAEHVPRFPESAAAIEESTFSLSFCILFLWLSCLFALSSVIALQPY